MNVCCRRRLGLVRMAQQRRKPDTTTQHTTWSAPSFPIRPVGAMRTTLNLSKSATPSAAPNFRKLLTWWALEAPWRTPNVGSTRRLTVLGIEFQRPPTTTLVLRNAFAVPPLTEVAPPLNVPRNIAPRSRWTPLDVCQLLLKVAAVQSSCAQNKLPKRRMSWCAPTRDWLTLRTNPSRMNCTHASSALATETSMELWRLKEEFARKWNAVWRFAVNTNCLLTALPSTFPTLPEKTCAVQLIGSVLPNNFCSRGQPLVSISMSCVRTKDVKQWKIMQNQKNWILLDIFTKHFVDVQRLLNNYLRRRNANTESTQMPFNLVKQFGLHVMKNKI